MTSYSPFNKDHRYQSLQSWNQEKYPKEIEFVQKMASKENNQEYQEFPAGTYTFEGQQTPLNFTYFRLNKNIYAMEGGYFSRGSFGHTYLARLVVNGTEVENSTTLAPGSQYVVKHISPQTLAKEGSKTQDEINNEAESEKEHLEKVGELRGYAQHQNKHVILMDNKGEWLRGYLEKNPKLTDEKRLDLAIDAVEKVRILHDQKKVAHLDLKPENLTVDKNGQVHIIDYGLSDDLNKKPAAFKGSSQYVPTLNRTNFAKIQRRNLDCFALMRTLHFPQQIAELHTEYTFPCILTLVQMQNNETLRKIFEAAGVYDAKEKINPQYPSLLQLKVTLILARYDISVDARLLTENKLIEINERYTQLKNTNENIKEQLTKCIVSEEFTQKYPTANPNFAAIIDSFNEPRAQDNTSENPFYTLKEALIRAEILTNTGAIEKLDIHECNLKNIANFLDFYHVLFNALDDTSKTKENITFILNNGDTVKKITENFCKIMGLENLSLITPGQCEAILTRAIQLNMTNISEDDAKIVALGIALSQVNSDKNHPLHPIYQTLKDIDLLTIHNSSPEININSMKQ